MTPLKIEQHGDGSVTIEGTRYAPIFFREFGCSFPKMVGQVLRIDKKDGDMLTVTIMTDYNQREHDAKLCEDQIGWNMDDPGETAARIIHNGKND